MRQAWYDRTGTPAEVLRVGDAPVPLPRGGEVLVRIRASGINPSDCKQRRGWPGMAATGRIVPHSDGAGVVDRVGEGVDPALIGQRVWVWGARGGIFYGFDGGPEDGTATEFARLPVGHVVPLPDSVGFDIGAAIGAPGCTAHHLVFADGDVSGQVVMVRGGAGAVGELAVSFASRAGAHVIATVSSPEKAAIARAAGAQQVIDYRRQDVADAVLGAYPGGVHRIIEVDFAANIVGDAALIRRDGVIASYSSPSDPSPTLPYYPLQFKGVTVRFVQGAALPSGAQADAVRAISRGFAEGWLRPTIAAAFPLDRIADAHALVESGAQVGKVVLEL